MATYKEIFIFEFFAENGALITISVAKDGYTGTAVRRAVGGSANLRRDVSGNIYATSLVWTAESGTEDEFTDLYTTNPLLYRVTLSFDGTPVWRGFITPELYSSPWVNAPFDVTLTASDNLSELKNHDFAALGTVSVGTLLSELLSHTGQDGLSVSPVSSMTGDGKSLLNLNVNIDHLAGESCYDVLNKVLESFHAFIYLDYSASAWILTRETDISSGSVTDLTVGSLSGSSDLFPVGSLSMQIVPAHNTLRISEAIITGNVADKFMSSNFGTVSGAPVWSETSSGPTVLLTRVPPSSLSGTPGVVDAIAGTVFNRLTAGHRYKLTFYARNAGFFVANTLIKFGVIIHGQDSQGSIYLTDGGGYTAKYPDDDYPISKAITGTSFAEYSYEFTIPEKLGNSDFTPRSGSFAARTIIEGDGSSVWTAKIQLAALSLSVIDLAAGLQTNIKLDNDARNAADDVELQFGGDIVNARSNIIKESLFKSPTIPGGNDFNTFMSIDNALSCAAPRLRLSGIVMFRLAGGWRLPQSLSTFHQSSANLRYRCESFDFDLLSGEIDMSMLSLPAASLEYSDIKTIEMYGASSGSSSGSSSGRPGKDGAAAGFGTPTATAVALPSGSAPTASVAASGPDTAKIFDFTFGLPQGSSGGALDIAARLATPPRLVLRSGNNEDHTYPEGIEVNHPMLGQSGYEAVLMVYGRNSRRSGVSSAGQKLRVHKRGWAVALGNLPLTGHTPLTGAASVISVNYGFKLSELRDFIVKRFCYDSQYSAAQLYERDYAQWIAEKRSDRGFYAERAASRLFGVAVRCVNPDFSAKLTSGKDLNVTTQTIGDTPRYLYSPVAPLRAVWSSTEPTERYKDVMGFSLTL